MQDQTQAPSEQSLGAHLIVLSCLWDLMVVSGQSVQKQFPLRVKNRMGSPGSRNACPSTTSQNKKQVLPTHAL